MHGEVVGDLILVGREEGGVDGNVALHGRGGLRVELGDGEAAAFGVVVRAEADVGDGIDNGGAIVDGGARGAALVGVEEPRG